MTDEAYADRTRDVSVYRLEPGHELETYWGVLDEKAAADYASDPVDGLGEQALLVFGERPPHPRAWVEHVQLLTGLDLGYLSSDAAAILIVRTGGETFALTFGSGRWLLRTHLIDRDFGLDLALRVLDADAVRQVRRQYLSAKARVDTSLVPAGQELWSFGIREHAELVRQLAGTIRSAASVDLSHSRRSRRRTDSVPIDCADRLRIPLPEWPHRLVADLREIGRVLHEREIDPSLAPLRWVRRIPSGRTDITDHAWETTLDLLATLDDAISLAYPGRFHGGPDISRYTGQVGRHRIDGPTLTLADLREGLVNVDRSRQLRTLQTSRIGGLDSSGDPLAADAPAAEWLTAQVDLSRDQRLVLLDGDWYDTSDGCIEHVARVVDGAFADRPEWSLPAWTAARRPDGRLEEHRILDLYDQAATGLPDDGRVVCADEFGPLNLQPRPGRGWFPAKRPARLRATFNRYGGVRHMIAALDLASGQLLYRFRDRKRWQEFLAFLRQLRRRFPTGRLYIVCDNFSPHRKAEVAAWCAAHNVELVFTPTNASWLNWIVRHEVA